MRGIRMRGGVAAGVTAVLALASCADPTGVVESEGVRFEAHSRGLTIRNPGSSAIYFFAIDQELAMRVLWRACGLTPVADPSQCGPGVRAGGKREVPGAEIPGWGGSPRVIVFWWKLVPALEGGFQVDSLRVVVVCR